MAEPVERGTVFAARLEPVGGSEQGGTRPVVVVSRDAFNRVMPVVTIVPLTSYKSGRVYSSEVKLPKSTAGLRAESLALCHQVRTISASRLGRRIGILPAEKMTEIDAALRHHLDL